MAFASGWRKLRIWRLEAGEDGSGRLHPQNGTGPPKDGFSSDASHRLARMLEGADYILIE
jgi:hypothetical protein